MMWNKPVQKTHDAFRRQSSQIKAQKVLTQDVQRHMLIKKYVQT